MRPKVLRQRLACAFFGAVLAGSLLGTGVAKAEPVSGCQSVPWGFLGSQQRQICDGMINPDGGWNRARVILVPAHYVPFTCSTYGGRYYASTSCNGGYPVGDRIISSEVYPVTEATVLPDEPGHLVGGA